VASASATASLTDCLRARAVNEQPPADHDENPDSGATADLDSYVAANAGRFTDEVLYATLVAAGHPPEDVRSALASASAQLRPKSAAPQAVRRILVAYIAVFALLSVGMLLNHRPPGYLAPTAWGGIQILAGSLGFAVVASLAWVASRAFFGALILALIVAYALGASTASGWFALIGLVTVLVIGGVVIRRQPRQPGVGAEASLALLLAIPMLMLFAVAGICVASGLPIPGGS
jgi:hypothetical protein